MPHCHPRDNRVARLAQRRGICCYVGPLCNIAITPSGSASCRLVARWAAATFHDLAHRIRQQLLPLHPPNATGIGRSVHIASEFPPSQPPPSFWFCHKNVCASLVRHQMERAVLFADEIGASCRDAALPCLAKGRFLYGFVLLCSIESQDRPGE
jgi:hypothetical protein